MEYRKINVILGWIVFAIATFVYVSTVEPTASFWDCGEYIATANRLEVGHPPGAPTFLLIGRVFSMLASPENVAYTINILSALCSSFTILFLFWTISAFGRKLATIRGEELNEGKTWAIFGSALVGSLAYTFSDTFWFSAVEGEVYAMASLLIAIVFWAILKWEQVANEPYADRWIIFIAYMIGLSVGVHLLSLLAIPAIAFVVYFKRYEPSAQGMAITGLIGVAVLGLVQNVIIPQVVNIASKFELFFVNSMGMPFNSGAILFLLLLTTGIIAGLFWTHQQRKPIVNTAILAFTAILIGYSSFAVILVRSQANTPIDENNPENMVNLLAYLNRDQYGTWPLLSGHYFNSTLDPQEPYTDGDPVYYPDEESGEYLISDSRKKSIPNYSKETTGFFPRMWSPQQKHIREYKKWSDFKGKRITVRDVTGQQKTIQKPRFSENMRYFGKYQIGHMYFRYFMWNFAGRQNDTQGHGGFRDGNWLTGIPFLDQLRLGNQEELSDDMLNHKARNELYMLPLLLGLIGLMFQFIRDPKNAFVVTLLFFFTGLAIIVYLNQYPIQPRERDYAYAASFYAFAIWIGLGVYALYEGLSKYGQNKLTAGAVTLICLLLVPGIMAKEEWDDHDRSGRYTARDIAKAYLDSCDENAILFTNGDNDTFPLWYVQEVEGYRTDVRVVNLTLLSTDWFVNQMKRKAYDGLPIPGQLVESQYRQGTRDYLRVIQSVKEDTYVDVKEVMNFITDDAQKRDFPTINGNQRLNFVPTKNLSLKVDKQKVLSTGIVAPELADQIVSRIKWSISGRIVTKSEIVLMDILANFDWDRPLYFANTMPQSSYFGLQKYMQHEGFAYRLVPVLTQNADRRYGYMGRVATDVMYDNMINKFHYGGLEDGEDLFLDENNLRFITNLRLNFVRLAISLFEEGKRDEAATVMDRCLSVTTTGDAPIDVTLLNAVELLYRLGDAEKANALATRMADRYEGQVRYFLSLDTKRRAQVSSDMQQGVGIIQQLAIWANQTYPQETFGPELQSRAIALQQELSAVLGPPPGQPAR